MVSGGFERFNLAFHIYIYIYVCVCATSAVLQMNDKFINVKVDREERPDVDRVYMSYIQATSGSGGWPMSVFLTPDLQPFFGGTYFPPRDGHGRPGFPTLLKRVGSKIWILNLASHLLTLLTV